MIWVTIGKSTRKVTHVENGKKTVVDGLPPKASLKAIETRLKIKKLKVK